jgi:hypothetical protein
MHSKGFIEQRNTAMPSRSIRDALLFYAITMALALGVALLVRQRMI